MYFTTDRKLGRPLIFSARILSQALWQNDGTAADLAEKQQADDLVEFLKDQVDRRERIADAASSLERRRRESSLRFVGVQKQSAQRLTDNPVSYAAGPPPPGPARSNRKHEEICYMRQVCDVSMTLDSIQNRPDNPIATARRASNRDDRRAKHFALMLSDHGWPVSWWRRSFRNQVWLTVILRTGVYGRAQIRRRQRRHVHHFLQITHFESHRRTAPGTPMHHPHSGVVLQAPSH